MSGWRVGFVVMPPELVDTFTAIQSALLCCPTVVSQHAAIYALDHQELMAAQAQKIRQSRDIAYATLAPLVEHGIIEAAHNHAGFYLFVKTREQDCNDLVMDMLKQAKVAVGPGKDFGPEHTAYFRLCYAREPEITQEGCNRLVQYFQENY